MTAPQTIPLDTCTLDLAALRVVRADGTELPLTPTEGRVLQYLAENHGRAVPRQELLERAWGYASGVRSRTVDTTIGRLRTKLEADPSDPAHLVTVFGFGYRFEVPALDTPGLFGRASDLRALRSALDDHRVVQLVGTAGVGKSTLMRAWADGLAQPPTWVPLDGDDSEAGLATAVATALGVTLSASDPVEAVGQALEEAGVHCLAFDALELAEGVAASAIGRWLARIDGLRVVASTRVPIDLPGTHLLRLEPLGPDDAAALFADRADLSGPDDPRIAAIVGALGGLPLAVELAASWTAVLTLDDLVQRVDRFDAHTLHDSILGSWEMLGPEQRAVLRGCACFEGSFTADAADAVCGRPTSDVLTALHQRSLLRAGDGELRLYDAVRAFVRSEDHAGLDPEHLARQARWLADQDGALWLTDQARALERVLPDDLPLATRLTNRLVHGHTTLGLSQPALTLSQQATRRASELSDDLAWSTWSERARALKWASRLDEAVEAAERALARGPTATQRMQTVLQIAGIRVSQGRPLSALEVLSDVDEPDGAPALVAAALHARGNALRMLGRTPEALAPYKRAVSLLARVDEPDLLARLYINLGAVQMEQGRPDLSFGHYSTARDLAEQHAPHVLPYIVGNQAESLRVMGRLEAARPVFEEAVGQARGIANLLTILRIQQSALEMELEHIDEAAVLIARALSEADSDHPRYEGFATLQQGGVHHVRGWQTLARETYERAIEILEGLGDQRHATLVRARLAALLAHSHPDQARTLMVRVQEAGLAEVSLLDALEVYAAIVELEHGADPTPVIDRMAQPDPDRPAPTRAAWNPEVRFALGLLDRALTR